MTTAPAADRVATPPELDVFPYGMVRRLVLGDADVRMTPAQERGFDDAATWGDPVADRLVAAMKTKGGKVLRQQFETALVEGIAAVDDAPVELRDFFAEAERVPYWVDTERLDRAADVVALLGSLGPSFFLVGFSATYTAADGNAVLLRAGETKTKAASRAVETMAWFLNVMQPGALAVGGSGYRACVRIRLIHAFMRSGMASRADWDVETDGLPVHQQVYCSVIAALSILPTVAPLAAGRWTSRADRAAVFHLWRYVAYLVGVDPVLIPADEHDAWRLFWAIGGTVNANRDVDGARLLGTALIDAYPTIFGTESGSVADRLGRRVLTRGHSALARVALGGPTADSLGYRRVGPLGVASLAGGVVAVGVPSLLDAVPGLRARRVQRRRRVQQRLVEQMCERTGADLGFPVER